MATNQAYARVWQLSVVCSNPTTPDAGDAVRYGNMTGVALEDENTTTGKTSVDFGPRGWNMSVTADAGTITAGDPIYYHDGSPNGTLTNTSTAGYFFGFALEGVTSAATETIEVAKAQPTVYNGAAMADGSVTGAKLAANTVTKGKLYGGFMKVTLIDGAAAGDHTVTGMAVGDELVFVGHISTKASIATLADLTSEFTVGAAKITNTLGTDTSSDQLLVIWLDLTA